VQAVFPAAVRTCRSAGPPGRAMGNDAMRQHSWQGLAVAAVLLWTPDAWADEVTERIEEGLRAYRSKNYPGATAALNEAVGMIGRKAAVDMTHLLPGPLPGWAAEAPESVGGGSDGAGVSRHYTRTYRERSRPEPGVPSQEYETSEAVRITVQGNSPTLQAMARMFANPAVAGPDAAIVEIGGRKAMFDRHENSLTTIVNDRVLVTVDADGTVRRDDLNAYFGRIDFKALESQAR